MAKRHCRPSRQYRYEHYDPDGWGSEDEGDHSHDN